MDVDTIHTRRAFLNRGLALVSAGAAVPFFLDRTALAVSGPRRSAGGRVLVVLQLAGGNDGLNTVVPYRNDLYYQARPRLGIAKDDVLKIDDTVGFHPQAVGLKQLYDDGLLGIIQGVGYPNPNRSHFVSTDIWSTADPRERMHEGWLGRYLDGQGGKSKRPAPKLGIALTAQAPLAMTGSRFGPVSFSSPDELTWRGPGAAGAGKRAFEKLNQAKRSKRRSEAAVVDEAGALAYLCRVAMDARASASEIQAAAGMGRGRRAQRGRPNRRGGGQLANQLTMVRRMIAAGLETKVYYVSMGGFDTHAGQAGKHQNLLKQLGDALAAFVSELKADGLLNRVTVMTFSEFGRRVAENGSQGTDHGAAAPLFIVGNRIKAGVHGKLPSLEPDKLDRGDLAWHTDFRSVYAAVLSDWLRADARRILGGNFEKLAIFK